MTSTTNTPTSQDVFARHFDRVRIVRDFDQELHGYRLLVEVMWQGVDRPVSMAWSLRDTAQGRKLADRLAKCISSGRCFYGAVRVMTDINGKTYVQAFVPVLGRTMNADLKRLGF